MEQNSRDQTEEPIDKNKQSFVDKLIISEDNVFLNAWQIFIALISLYSVLANGFYGAFGFPVRYDVGNLVKC